MIEGSAITGVIGLAVMFLLIALRTPIGIAMSVVGITGSALIIGPEAAFSLLAIEPSSAMSSEGLAVIAMFLLMGNLAHTGGLSSELYRLAYAFLGHRRGGLILATIGACAGFGAVSGSSVATTATMVRIALPEMLRRGYASSLAAGSIASGGTLGMIIPPSLVMILYAILTENSIITLFLAAIVPGILAVIFYFITVSVTVRLFPDAAPAGKRSSWKERMSTLRQSWAVVTLMLAISGGIYSGFFTVSEAASVGVSIAFFLALLRKKLTGKNFLACLSDTALSTGMIFIVIIGASVFSYFASLTGLPAAIVLWIESLQLPSIMVILLLLLFYLIMGSVFDSIAAMVLTLPFVYPLIINMGYDPIWWGVINIVVMELGMITPPLGINVFVLHGMANNLPLRTIFRGVTPFIIADLMRLLLLIFIPTISLWLPHKLGWL